MRNVLRNTDEVFHYWANQVQSHGKAGSVSFDGPTLYSYAEPIAKLLPNGTVMHTTQSWSVTTSSHQSSARSASQNRRRVSCRRVQDSPRENMAHARDQIAVRLQDALDALKVVKKDGTPTINGQNKATKLRAEALRLAEQANDYLRACHANNLGANDALIDTANLESVREELKRIEELRRQEEEKRRTERAIEAVQDLALWRQGGHCLRGRLHDLPVALRLASGRSFIETSHGAEIPTADAIALWPVVLAVKSRGEPLLPRRQQLGNYTLNEIRANGSIRVGCHDIAFSELAKMAALLGLTEKETA